MSPSGNKNPSSSGEGTKRVYWSHAEISPRSAHKNRSKGPSGMDPQYRKPVLTGDIAIRVRDLIRQIAMEHELKIISGKVASDHIHVFLSYRAHQDISQII